MESRGQSYFVWILSATFGKIFRKKNAPQIMAVVIIITAVNKNEISHHYLVKYSPTDCFL